MGDLNQCYRPNICPSLNVTKSLLRTKFSRSKALDCSLRASAYSCYGITMRADNGRSREGTGGPGDPGAKTIHPGKSQVYVGFLTEILASRV